MEIKVQRLEETSFSYEDVTVLLHTAFQERLDQGLYFTTSRLSSADFRQRARNGIVLVAFDPKSQKLLGTAMTHFRQDAAGILYAEEEHKGIMPDVKRMGIGSLLENSLQQLAREGGTCYIITDTATGAKSSIRFHLKNGFFKWKLVSFSSTDYYSIVFRKQIKPDKKWNNLPYRKAFFFLSCVKTLITKKKNGAGRKPFNYLLSLHGTPRY